MCEKFWDGSDGVLKEVEREGGRGRTGVIQGVEWCRRRMEEEVTSEERNSRMY